MRTLPCLVLAAGALLLALFLLRRRLVLRRRGVAVQARCTAYRPQEGGGTRVTLRYPVPDGRTLTHLTDGADCPPGTREGDLVEVLYDPRDPSRAATARRARTSPGRHYDLLGLFAVSLAAALAAALV
ncbi:DUF3592 domain-containing protein [Streptomyces xanthophaeus]|uniref:DUF3592 domain-containing protein n=1 Tax=Streptomyces xanthophaeus TaxID=67385 RepID=UPI00386509D1|nr:DUF3592 domain-containing protein [Streptomyces xanthophaeus]WST61058.1 DUF3592 domain-containing protein [Streptomyces xanthophaeus]